jgi:hypothetical protein
MATYLKADDAKDNMRQMLRDLAATLDETDDHKTFSQRDIYIWLHKSADTVKLTAKPL